MVLRPLKNGDPNGAELLRVCFETNAVPWQSTNYFALGSYESCLHSQD